jgi:hypothetical protein
MALLGLRRQRDVDVQCEIFVLRTARIGVDQYTDPTLFPESPLSLVLLCLQLRFDPGTTVP